MRQLHAFLLLDIKNNDENLPHISLDRWCGVAFPPLLLAAAEVLKTLPRPALSTTVNYITGLGQ